MENYCTFANINAIRRNYRQTMKILHTSDWHLGHNLYGYDRTEEQTAMLQQIIDIVRREKPDAFLLSGDVYHTAQPSAAVQTMFTDAIVQIHDAHPDMTIVITAGNHDSGAKHEIFRTPWQALKVYSIGNLDKEHPENHIVEVPGKGYIIAIPYCYERSIPEGFFQDLEDEVMKRNEAQAAEHAERADSLLPVILMAHTTVKGCDFKGHDNATEYTVGGIDSLDISDLGDGYDYLALGHIHHEQWIRGGHHRIRYSGSPLAVSFDESYEHSVSIVNIEHHRENALHKEEEKDVLRKEEEEEVKLEKITIENPRPLVSLPSDGAASWEEAKKLLEGFPADIPAYIRLNVEIEDFLPLAANQEAENLTKDKACRFCLVNAKRKAKAQAEQKAMTVQEFQSESPIDIARRFAEDSGIEFDEDMLTMFKEITEQL